MNFNLVEMYNGLLRFNKHILNELAEGLKHLPNLDGVSKGDSLIINEQGNPAWGSALICFLFLHFSILLLQQFIIILNIINLKHNIL